MSALDEVKGKFLGVEADLLDYLNFYVQFFYEKNLDLSFKTLKKNIHLGYITGN